ncbi:hypothetical protein F4818DRAFT_53186 [Hypoxylon cercidicola]|nr:hypothetical protein F4818DRAFT_53186 [Hypoxylon cercidicola]
MATSEPPESDVIPSEEVSQLLSDDPDAPRPNPYDVTTIVPCAIEKDDDTSFVSRSLIKLPLLPRLFGFGAEAKPFKGIAGHTGVYAGVDVNLEYPVWIRSSDARTPIPAEALENDLVAGEKAGLKFFCITGVNGKGTGGNTKPWVLFHYSLCCPGVVSRAKRFLNESTQSDATDLETAMWEKSVTRGKPYEPHPGLMGDEASPVMKMPFHTLPNMECTISLPLLAGYPRTPAIETALSEFLNNHAEDFVTQAQALVAAHTWLHLKNHPPQEACPSLVKEYPLPDVPLARFVLYFMHYLRRVEAFGLTGYPHPFRFISRAYAFDVARADRYTVYQNELDEGLFERELGDQPVSGENWGCFFPFDMCGTQVPPFGAVAGLGLAGRRRSLTMLTQRLGDICNWDCGLFDHGGMFGEAESGLRHSVLLPLGIYFALRAPVEGGAAPYSEDQILSVGTDLDDFAVRAWEEDREVTHVLGQDTFAYEQMDELYDMHKPSSGKALAARGGEEDPLQASTPSSGEIPYSALLTESELEKRKQPVASAKKKKAVRVPKSTASTASTSTPRKGRVAKPAKSPSSATKKGKGKELAPTPTTSKTSGESEVQHLSTVPKRKDLSPSPTGTSPSPSKIRRIVDSIYPEFEKLDYPEASLVISQILQRKANEVKQGVSPVDLRDLLDVSDLVGIMQKSLNPLPHPAKSLGGPYDPATDIADYLGRVKSSSVSLTYRLKKLDGDLLSMCGWTCGPELELANTDGGFVLRGLVPPRNPLKSGVSFREEAFGADDAEELSARLITFYDQDLYPDLFSQRVTLNDLTRASASDDAAARIKCFKTIKGLRDELASFTLLCLFLKHCMVEAKLWLGDDAGDDRVEARDLLQRTCVLQHISASITPKCDVSCIIRYTGHTHTQKAVRQVLGPVLKSWVGPVAEGMILGSGLSPKGLFQE